MALEGIHDEGRRIELAPGTLERGPDEARTLELALATPQRVSRIEREVERALGAAGLIREVGKLGLELRRGSRAGA